MARACPIHRLAGQFRQADYLIDHTEFLILFGFHLRLAKLYSPVFLNPKKSLSSLVLKFPSSIGGELLWMNLVTDVTLGMGKFFDRVSYKSRPPTKNK